ncbi:MAG TPA: hypothetical protein PK280_11990 [Planctomycetota bacterium]|nr:hypothetical protein [Planctomycetota bacterium]
MTDDPGVRKDATLPQPAEQEAPPAADGEEVEYVYEDENGNPIAAPQGGFDAEEFEVVEVEAPADADAAAAAQPSPAADAPATAPAPAGTPEAAGNGSAVTATAATQRLVRPASSSRRTGDRKSGRQPKPMTPEELKNVRRRVIMVLGLLSLIPILGIALIFMLYKKNYIGPPKTRVVENDFTQGEQLFKSGSPHYTKANSLYDQNKRPQAYAEYKLCEKDYSEALDKIRKWSDGKDLSNYHNVETCMRQLQIELRHVRERLIQLEASGDDKAPKQ